MTPDADSFRGLLGLAPAGRIAVLRAVLAGEKSLDTLVRVSALPRRDVEEFLAALDDLPGDPGKLLDEYTASRPAVRPGEEKELARAAASLIAGVPAPLKRLDHVQATADTLVRRVTWLTEAFALGGRSVVFAGDHDVTSLLLHRVAPDANVTVTDIDERLLAYVDEAGGARVRCVYADFRFGLPPTLAESADVVFTDPPYTAEGLGLFLTRSLQALRRDEPAARIVIAYGHSRRRPDLGLAAQREIGRQDVAIDGMLPAFNSYDGAQAVGSASDLYCLQPTPRAFRRLGPAARHGERHESQAHGIYTHGEQSVEAGASSAADLIPLLAGITFPGTSSPAAVGVVTPGPGTAGAFALSVRLGKLLADGVHPSVTGRAAEIVVDLRDDPGPWLLRTMLALNAPRAVFLVRSRHEALPRLTAGAPEWDLLRAKYVSVSPVAVGDLVALRCELAREPYRGAEGHPDPGSGIDRGSAGDGPVDAGLELARFVTRRAHGQLRNVWREGLIALAARRGQPLTKRAAADLAERHAAGGAASRPADLAANRPADLALRLIDVPAAHFQDLHAALRASAAAVSGLPQPPPGAIAVTGLPLPLPGSDRGDPVPPVARSNHGDPVPAAARSHRGDPMPR